MTFLNTPTHVEKFVIPRRPSIRVLNVVSHAVRFVMPEMNVSNSANAADRAADPRFSSQVTTLPAPSNISPKNSNRSVSIPCASVVSNEIRVSIQSLMTPNPSSASANDAVNAARCSFSQSVRVFAANAANPVEDRKPGPVAPLGAVISCLPHHAPLLRGHPPPQLPHQLGLLLIL